MKCSETEPHEPHWHVVRAGSIVVAQGECWGRGNATEPAREATEHATHIETRTVCRECGQQQGLFHKGCDGTWIEQRRTVSEWWS